MLKSLTRSPLTERGVDLGISAPHDGGLEDETDQTWPETDFAWARHQLL